MVSTLHKTAVRLQSTETEYDTKTYVLVLHCLVWISLPHLIQQTPTQRTVFPKPNFSEESSDGDFCSLKQPWTEAHTFDLPHKISAPYSVCWQPYLRQTYCPCIQYGCLWLLIPKPIIWVL